MKLRIRRGYFFILATLSLRLAIGATPDDLPASTAPDSVRDPAAMANVRNSFQAQDFASAREQLKSVFAEDPDNIEAKYLNAYCAKELGDTKKFLSSVRKLRSRYNELTPIQRQTLEKDYVVVSFQKRDFQGVIAQAEDFATSYPNAAAAELVEEAGLLAKLECGLKRAHDAKNYHQAREAQTRASNWSEGQDWCREFNLALRDGRSSEGLRAALMDDDEFKMKYWTAMVVMGRQEEIAQGPVAPAAGEREMCEAICLEARLEYWPEETADNRARVEAFCRTAKDPQALLTVRRGAANRSFRRAYEMHNVAAYSRRNGETQQADGYSSDSLANFDWYRSVFEELLAEHDGSLTAKDKLLLERDYLKSYYFEERLDEMRQAAIDVAGRYPEQSKGWALGKVFEAMAMAVGPERDFEQAAACLDAVLAKPIDDKTQHENINVLAAFWRAFVADSADDAAKVQEMVDMVTEGYPEGNLRTMMLSQFGEPKVEPGEQAKQ